MLLKRIKNNEIYFSIDIETDGPIPVENSLLSLGCAAFSQDGELLDTWSANFETLLGASPNPKTKTEFWDINPKAWKACRENLQPIDNAMRNFVNWIKECEKKYSGRAVAVCAPSGFDFTFVYWYLMKFVGYSPFSFSCIDVKTYAMATLKLPYRKSTKRNYPRRWFDPSANHSHIAVEDAVEQGRIFINMMRQNIKQDS